MLILGYPDYRQSLSAILQPVQDERKGIPAPFTVFPAPEGIRKAPTVARRGLGNAVPDAQGPFPKLLARDLRSF